MGTWYVGLVNVVWSKHQVLIPEVMASLCRRANRYVTQLDKKHDGNTIEVGSYALYGAGNCSINNYPQELTDKEIMTHDSTRTPVSGWPIVMIDYNDCGYIRAPCCAVQLTALLGSSHYVRFATRQHMKGRGGKRGLNPTVLDRESKRHGNLVCRAGERGME